MKEISPLTINSFDITYYPGLTAQDVIPELIKKLKITFAKLDKNSEEYKAIKTYIRLLNTYLTISNTQSTETTKILSFFNKLSEYLQNYIQSIYPEYDIYIKPQGRIKSPISANKKIKQKIAAYREAKKDLDNLNISDFIAFRFVVEARNAFGNLIPEEKSVEICYLCVFAAIEYIRKLNSIQLMKVSKITPNANVPDDIYKPLIRPTYIEENDEYIKDFVFSPKPESNYQSNHLQFSLNTDSSLISGELQFRTFLMNEYAERGHASHKKYKTREKVSYLAVPQILTPTNPYSQRLEFLTPDEAFEKHLGFSPKQISPFMSYTYLRNFLEENRYAYPILPLYFKEGENNEIFFFDDLKSHAMPLDVVSLDKQEEMYVLVGNIFDEKTFEPDSLEHEFI